jgi:8-oxo-dGTP pyrophosphatase MutT (NUDIX family)
MTSPHGPSSPFTTLSREPAFDASPVFRVERLVRRSGRTGAVRSCWRVEMRPWVNVVAITTGGDLVLVRQERHGIEAPSLEVPGGVVDDGEDPAAAALRELLEETGYRGRVAEPLGWTFPNPALQGNRLTTYLVRDCVRVGEPLGDGDEELEVVLVPAASARERVRRGEIVHALVLAAFYLWECATLPPAR